MSFIEIKAGGPDIPDGVYPVELTSVSDPKTVTAQRGEKAGQDMDLIDWSFNIMSGPHAGTELQASTSLNSGPRSKMYAFLTALFGGNAPPIGTRLEKSDLVGRQAQAVVQRDDSGYVRVKNLLALPTGVQQVAAAPPPTGIEQASSQAASGPTSLRDQVSAEAERQLPF